MRIFSIVQNGKRVDIPQEEMKKMLEKGAPMGNKNASKDGSGGNKEKQEIKNKYKAGDKVVLGGKTHTITGVKHTFGLLGYDIKGPMFSGIGGIDHKSLAEWIGMDNKKR